MTEWWYWALFALAALVLLVGVPLAAWWERRARRLDREWWMHHHPELYARNLRAQAEEDWFDQVGMRYVPPAERPR